MIISSDINRISNRFLEQVKSVLVKGGVIIYPTDTGYALGCLTSFSQSVKKIRDIRGLDKNHHFSLICKDLSHIGKLAQIQTSHFRILKKLTPSPHTFIFRATKMVPSVLCFPKKQTIGLRVLEHPFCQKITQYIEDALLSVSLNESDIALNQELNDAFDIQNSKFGKQVDLIIDTGFCKNQPSSVVDFSDTEISIIRKGVGDLSLLIPE